MLSHVERGKITRMTKPAEVVLADALRLGEDERAELAAEILASLDGPADPDADEAWADEIRLSSLRLKSPPVRR